MFSTDDAFMDMTQSHTIKIVNSAELLADISLQNYDILPTSRERTVMFTADDGSMDTTLNHTVNITSGPVSLPTSRSMDLNAEKKNISSPVPCLDPGFENFLASLFKPNGPSANPEITRMTFPSGISSAERNSSLAQIKTQRPGVDKENQAPGSVSAVMEKSVITPRKTDQSSYGSVLCPKSDVSMSMTRFYIQHSLPVNIRLSLEQHHLRPKQMLFYSILRIRSNSKSRTAVQISVKILLLHCLNCLNTKLILVYCYYTTTISFHGK